ncbi:hypothetical protein Goshw_029643 [Gossypium schwendimanii]|uniref:DUF7745 domain-containing protein n=1 Tax=Gossypium schwendimanii TaxID=34291 RepID=A0A7J9N2G4_GOSSC|nr:hypothetical protein [Gossypium schwendimanii]
MIKIGLIDSDLGKRCEETRNYYEFHHEEEHKIQKCKEFKVLDQGMMDDKEVEFYEEIREEGSICASESTMKVSNVNHPMVIISRPKNNDDGVLVAPKITIQKLATFFYKDSKKVPWNYEYNVTISGRETLIGALKEDQGIVDTVSYRVYSENYSPLKEIVAIPRRDDISKEKWMVILQNLQEEDIEWRAPWMLLDEIIYRCGNFDWVPLLGIWEAIGYAPLLVLRQYMSRQFVPATQGLAQCKFSYKGDGYKKKIREMYNA